MTPLTLPITLALYSQRHEVALLLFLIAALTDILDGPMARRSGTQSPDGALFDGLADLVLAAGVVAWVWWLSPQKRGLISLYLPLIAGLSLAYYWLAYRKTGRFLMLHLATGKLTGALAFLLFPLTLMFNVGNWYLHLVGASAIFYYLESSIYLLRGRTDPDGRSAFSRDSLKH